MPRIACFRSRVAAVDVWLSPEPDGATQRAVAAALAQLPVVGGQPHEAYMSAWRLAGLAEAGESRGVDEDRETPGAYGFSPRSIRGVTRA